MRKEKYMNHRIA